MQSMAENVTSHNRDAWNTQAASGESRWSQPVEQATIDRARAGDWAVILTPNRLVPRDWFGDHLAGSRILALASGGGQQAPMLAAAGARVTSFDNSDTQLALDRAVADACGLTLTLEQGDMADLSRFEPESFELIFHPISNVFVPDVRVVWRECARVLSRGGRLLSGFMNPSFYLFDHAALDAGAQPVVRNALPYSDLTVRSAEDREAMRARGEALEFSHSLDDQIGGQIAARFSVAGFFEDRWDDSATPLNRFMPTSMATLAIKTG